MRFVVEATVISPRYIRVEAEDISRAKDKALNYMNFQLVDGDYVKVLNAWANDGETEVDEDLTIES
jgi:hypothetical protein